MPTVPFRTKFPRCPGAAALAAAFLLLPFGASAQTRLRVPPANITASDSDSNLPANANDNTLATRWSANAGPVGVQWLQYKLGGCYKVSRASLAWYRGDSRKYRLALQISNDGNVWKDVFWGTNSGTTAALKPYAFGDRSARYVRLQGMGNDVNSWVSLSEMEIWTSGAGDCGAAPDDPVLTPSVPPGGNFNLSTWQLQLPTGRQGSPDTVGMQQLVSGFSNQYFYTDKADGALVFWCPENGVHTPNSRYGRSELREMNPNNSAANWDTDGNHTLSATLKVEKVPSNVTIGQIHVGSPLRSGLAPSTKPLVELYYHGNGDIVVGIENSPAGGQTVYKLGNVPLNTKFTYQIRASGSALTVSINGRPHTYTMPSSFNGYGQYFKAGAYIQSNGPSASVGALVKFYALRIAHD